MKEQLARVRTQLERILGREHAAGFLAQQLDELGLTDVDTADDLFDLGTSMCGPFSEVAAVGRAARIEALAMGAAGFRSRDGSQHRLSVLLVDDDDLVTRVLARCLKSFPVDVQIAHSFDHAQQILETASPDVVATDHLMPGGSGARLLDMVADHHKGIARVVFSGTASVHTMQGWLDTGRIHGWLQKPFVAHELFDALAAAKQASTAA